jgi:2-C-methyl-D-erythritol 4-phosphate cytidylyltransferase
MNVAVILSAGSGSRFGSDIPKQFINLAGKNIIEYTIEAFDRNALIDEICIVADKQFHKIIQNICNKNNFTKVKKIIEGGEERKDSSYNAIKAYKNQENINLIFHDGVRPFVSQRIINDTIDALKKYKAVDVAIPTADTIIKVKNNFINNIPNRDDLLRGQTPQAFKLETIQMAHELSLKDDKNTIFTDDCGLVKKYLNEKIFVVKGDEKNIKITYPADLLLAEKLIQLRVFTSTPTANLKNLKNKVIVVFGGNSGIGASIVKLSKKYGAKAISYSRSSQVDVKNEKDIEKALKDCYKKYKNIDIIINCSAILTKSPIVKMDSNSIYQEIFTNYIGSVMVAKYAYTYLKKSKGSLILFSSSSYTRGRKNYSIYSSTKAAIVNFAEAIASEWEDHNIKVNVINPARTKTPMRIKHFGKEEDSMLLDAEYVAKITLNTTLQNFTGLVVDVKKGI